MVNSLVQVILLVFIVVLVALIIILIISIVKKIKGLIIFSAVTLALFIVMPLVAIILLFSERTIPIKGFDEFEKEIKTKYDYVKDVSDFNYETMYYAITIDTKRNLNWDEMKGIYLDTKVLLLSDSLQRDLKQYYEEETNINGNFTELKIEFDFMGDGKSNIQIEGDNLNELNGGKPWHYWDYGHNSFKITPWGELIN